MARFSQDSIERVKEAADIVEVVSAHTDLRQSGQRLTGLCPFHDERTPSFSVNAVEKVYHCFGCGVGGDVITFLEEKEGLDFAGAVESLADRYGVELEREDEDPRLEAERKRRSRLVELLDRTAGYYASYLWDSDEARKAREYLLGRGLREEALRAFDVGYAPNAWDTVYLRGQQAGYSVEELVASGLVKKGNKGGFLDHFRARIMFPIRDGRGRMQGMGGRATREQQRAKYVNSPEGALFHKSRIVYGIDKARAAIAKRGRAVVVEGYTDVIAAHQAGVEETVAVMGTAITPDQIKLLSAHTEEVVLALDADRAGREAMLRAQRVAQGKRVRLRVVSMPVGEDPAEMLAGAAPGSTEAERFEALVAAAVDLPAFHVRTLLDDADTDSPAGRDRALDEVAPVLSAMSDSITRDELEREVAERLAADPGLVARRLADAGKRAKRVVAAPAAPVVDGDPGPDRGGAAVEPPRTLSAGELREQALLAMCIASPADGRRYLDKLTNEHLSSPAMARVRDWLAGHLDEPGAGLERDDHELADMVTQLIVRSQREPASPEAMELNFLLLEKAVVERRLVVAKAAGGQELVDLQKRRAELSEGIAHHKTAVPKPRP
ncbi:MAG: DNA primase [Actinomycetota bacterium]|nr:DNA primase [Actinomycetota bacterium]